MELRSRNATGEDAEHILEVFGNTYDISDRPVLAYCISVLMILSVSVFIVGAIYVGTNALARVFNQLSIPIEAVASVVITLLTCWYALGFIKYAITGSAEPFFEFNFSINKKVKGEDNEE